MKGKMKFYRIVDRWSEDPRLSSTGGDYDYGRIVAVDDGPVGVCHWTSADFDYCSHCGTFSHAQCEAKAAKSDLRLQGVEVVEVTEDSDPERFGRYLQWWKRGWFAVH
jgi:hypothetical protein